MPSSSPPARQAPSVTLCLPFALAAAVPHHHRGTSGRLRLCLQPGVGQAAGRAAGAWAVAGRDRPGGRCSGLLWAIGGSSALSSSAGACEVVGGGCGQNQGQPGLAGKSLCLPIFAILCLLEAQAGTWVHAQTARRWQRRSAAALRCCVRCLPAPVPAQPCGRTPARASPASLAPAAGPL